MSASTGDAAYWRDTIARCAASAVSAAADVFCAQGDLADTTGSALYAIGEAVAYEVRRRVLRAECERTAWNLSHVADRLRMKGAGKVLEAIRAHGLEIEYEIAKAAGVAGGYAGGKGNRARKVVPRE
jgi:hypothetical protein